METDIVNKNITFNFNSKSEAIPNKSDIDDMFESIYENTQKYKVILEKIHNRLLIHNSITL